MVFGIPSRKKQAEYSSVGSDLEELTDWFSQTSIRLSIADKMINDSAQLSQDISNIILQEFPDGIISIFSSSPESSRESILERDIDFLIRILTYCLVSGSSTPIESFMDILSQQEADIRYSLKAYSRALICIRNKYKSEEGFDELSPYLGFMENILS